jgi:hypothetical protein
MQNINYKIPGFKAESSISPSMTTELLYNRDNDYSLGNIIPGVCVPCCNTDPYCRNCKRMCSGHKGEDYYFCLDRCVPGGITWP